MKKLLILLLISLTIVSLVACSNDNPENVKESIINSLSNTSQSTILETTVSSITRICDTQAHPNQSTNPIFTDFTNEELDIIDNVQESFYVEFYLDKNVYAKDDNIKIRVESIGELTFQMYAIPYVEMYDSINGEWIRLTYAPDEYYYGLSSYTCYGGSVLNFKPLYLIEDYNPGMYRLIAFVNDTPIYSPTYTLKWFFLLK